MFVMSFGKLDSVVGKDGNGGESATDFFFFLSGNQRSTFKFKTGFGPHFELLQLSGCLFYLYNVGAEFSAS